MRKVFATSLAVVWGLVIIGFTLQEGSASGALSSGLTRTLYGYFEVIPGFTNLFDFTSFHTLVRAGAHVFNYFVFALLVSNAVRYYTPLTYKVSLLLVLFGALYGFLDETLQRLVPGRGFAWLDVLYDTIGFAVGLFSYQLIKLFINLPKKK